MFSIFRIIKEYGVHVNVHSDTCIVIDAFSDLFAAFPCRPAEGLGQPYELIATDVDPIKVSLTIVVLTEMFLSFKAVALR